MINLELYRIFKIVADEENLTRASEILHISQPAVTKHIKNLENELKIELFKRSKYGMILNDNGKELYEKIKEAINILSNARKMFDVHNEIKLGVHVNMPNRLYNDSILKFYKENTNMIVNIHRLDAKNLFLALSKQEIDIAFYKKYDEELYNKNNIKFIPLGKLEDIFVVNSNSKYLKQKLTKKDLIGNKIYTLKKFTSAYKNLINLLSEDENKENLKEIKEQKDIVKLTNVENIDFTGIIELLKVRDIIAVVTKEYVEEKLKNNELKELELEFKLPSVEYGVYYNANNSFKELNKFISNLKNS